MRRGAVFNAAIVGRVYDALIPADPVVMYYLSLVISFIQ